MNALTERAYAKLNLALHVRAKGAGGYHDIETVFAFCEHGDELSAEPAETLSLAISGPFAGGLVVDDNLVMQAARKLRGDTPRGARLKLLKSLPPASGIGGGSADAAAALRLLNRLWDLELRDPQLESVGRQLGADVAACLRSVAARGSGRGDTLAPVELGLSGTPVLLVNPRVELSTGDVFAAWDGLDRGPLDDWRLGRNDLEEPAMKRVPQIRAVVAWLSAQSGVELVRMSGSGATCFALFASEELRDRASEAVPREWWRLATRLR